ncbi:hypothetical protein SLS58_005709 [Diplodia intermedia]|uniref:Uncharacterized protein n=1 Tax=Diplodia intermedia TaxID=856260 RepID=A0ABR3TQQ4_9PEZI
MSDIEEQSSIAHDILQHEPSGEVQALPEAEDMRMDSENSQLTDVDTEHNDDSPESSKEVNIQYPERLEESKDFDTNRRTSLHVEEVESHDLREVELWLTAQKAPESTPTDGRNDPRTICQPPQEMPETISPYNLPTVDGINGEEELAETAVDGAADLLQPDAPEVPTGEPPTEDATEDDDRKPHPASLADVLASLENQNGMTRRVSVKSAAIPNLTTIDEVSEVPTPEIRETPLQHDHAATDIAEAQTVYGHTVLLDVEHSEDDTVARIEEEPTIGRDAADERSGINQWQSRPEVDTQDLSVEDMEQSYKAPSDEPEDRGSLGSSMEESLPESGDVIAQATEEVPDGHHPNAENIIPRAK